MHIWCTVHTNTRLLLSTNSYLKSLRNENIIIIIILIIKLMIIGNNDKIISNACMHGAQCYRSKPISTTMTMINDIINDFFHVKMLNTASRVSS